MSLLKEIKALQPTPKDLRKFGIMVGGIFLALGLWWLYRGKSYALFAVIPGALLFLPAVVYPASLRLIYLLWMGLALVLGAIVSTIILTLFFYFIVTPIGLIARMVGQDFLSLKLSQKAMTYWVPRPKRAPAAEHYPKQF